MRGLGRWGPRLHAATTKQVGGIYPFQAESGMGSRGIFVGSDLYGSGCFSYDGWALYNDQHIISGLNTIVTGQLGKGKSSLVKTVFEFRPLVFGRKVRVLDPKGERRKLCEALGTEPIKLEPDGHLRINPLDQQVIRARAGLSARRMLQEQAHLLQTIASLSLGRRLVPIERAGLFQALQRAVELAPERGRDPVIGDVAEVLFRPTEDMARHLHAEPDQLAKDCREPALELQRMVNGDLGGMFDEPTSPGIDFLAPYLVLDLSEVYSSDALPILMCCAATWMQQGLLAEPDPAPGQEPVHQIWVIDEAWRLMSDLATARWARDASKFSRKFGIQLVLVFHRFSDATGAGDEGTEQVKIAEGLIEDSETHVVYGQGHDQMQATKRVLGLSDTEAAKVRELPKGTALWKVGTRRFVVQHLLSPEEEPLIATDEAMAG